MTELNSIHFAISEAAVQGEAERKIGRALTAAELDFVMNGIGRGLCKVQWDVISAAIDTLTLSKNYD